MLAFCGCKDIDIVLSSAKICDSPLLPPLLIWFLKPPKSLVPPIVDSDDGTRNDFSDIVSLSSLQVVSCTGANGLTIKLKTAALHASSSLHQPEWYEKWVEKMINF